MLTRPTLGQCGKQGHIVAHRRKLIYPAQPRIAGGATPAIQHVREANLQPALRRPAASWLLIPAALPILSAHDPRLPQLWRTTEHSVQQSEDIVVVRKMSPGSDPAL